MKKLVALMVAGALILSLGVTGCSQKKNDSAASTSTKKLENVSVRIGHYGGTCEAPVYIAYEKGFFKARGLNVELVKTNFDTLKEGIGTGKIDAVQASPGLFKPIEQGLNIKLTNGIHTGCIQAVVPVNSTIQSVKDLKGKNIGVDAIGGVPQVFLSIELGKARIDPAKDVTWKAYPGAQLQQAMDKGELDAYATWDPFPQLSIDSGKARKIFGNSHASGAEANQFCCFVGINGNIVKNKPDVAKAITDAIEEGAAWVGAHPQEAAQLAVDRKYIDGDVATNAKLLASYEFINDPSRAKASVTTILNAMKEQNILDKTTDVSDFANKVFVDLK
jgi:NitT/TauT family transport system substrate-binding protein